jgi:D-serine dehydratase
MTAASVENLMLDDTLKGIPGGVDPFLVGAAGAQRWNVLAEDLPLPLAVLKQSAMDRNSAWMRRFLDASGAVLAPHGKTTMSPQLFRRQIEDGAWGITLATVDQIQVARQFGVQRILLANQLVGKQAIRYIMDALARDPDFDFYCLVDSLDGVRALGEAARAAGLRRPLQVLLEGGVEGRRTGCRSHEEAMNVARAVRGFAPHLALRGVEGFEGVISAPTDAETEALIAAFVAFLGKIAQGCDAEGLFADGPVILSAGGSAFYDIVARVFAALDLGRETLMVIRSGCYLTHDSIMYAAFARQMLARWPEARDLGEPPCAALEVWAYVQSRPEPGRVILTMGKRDSSHDAGLPKPLSWYRPGGHAGPEELVDGCTCVEMNDQHLFLDVPDSAPLAIGDMVAFGISHPCLTFDKWQVIPIVDDDYNVVSAIRTFF